jgi:hypothetical protein
MERLRRQHPPRDQHEAQVLERSFLLQFFSYLPILTSLNKSRL